jgi:hypothetical protein
MAKTLKLRHLSTVALRRRKLVLLQQVLVSPLTIRASYVRQLVRCGKANCRCKQGRRHGPFYYLVQCLAKGNVQKFLLKTPEARRQARVAIAAYTTFQSKIEELSQLNTELLRRGDLLQELKR